jgi:hypothetical protein
MVKRTFDGGTLDSERVSRTDHSPSGTPLMTFTLIDGDTDDDQALKTEVLVACASARTTATSGAGAKGSAATLRRILGSGGEAPSGLVDATPVSGTSSRVIDAQLDAPAPEEGGAMLRPHPAVDRLDNEFTLVPPAAKSHDPASRRFLRRKR